MTGTIAKSCKCCGKPMTVRLADHNRGWGVYCSKSCKAKKQEERTGASAAYHNRQNNFRGSGVDRETYMQYAEEFGGIPEFDRRGHYVGFTGGGFDNTQNQNHDPNEDRVL